MVLTCDRKIGLFIVHICLSALISSFSFSAKFAVLIGYNLNRHDDKVYTVTDWSILGPPFDFIQTWPFAPSANRQFSATFLKSLLAVVGSDKSWQRQSIATTTTTTTTSNNNNTNTTTTATTTITTTTTIQYLLPPSLCTLTAYKS